MESAPFTGTLDRPSAWRRRWSPSSWRRGPRPWRRRRRPAAAWGQARAVLVSRSIQQAPFELKSYVRDYGLSVSHLCVILTPESRKNLNVTPALEDSLLARVREAAALYSPGDTAPP
ncbi:hypothetical protein M5E87_06380 [Flavonifractor plautii]|nr:hypothetical protein M5E87_06380 [Flavonifractor plautii]